MCSNSYTIPRRVKSEDTREEIQFKSQGLHVRYVEFKSMCSNTSHNSTSGKIGGHKGRDSIQKPRVTVALCRVKSNGTERNEACASDERDEIRTHTHS